MLYLKQKKEVRLYKIIEIKGIEIKRALKIILKEHEVNAMKRNQIVKKFFFKIMNILD